jgi:hypothetical protein
VPCAGWVTIAYVSSVPSASLPDSVIVAGASSSVVTVWSAATGASFTALTVIETVATFESAVPSRAVNEKLSSPL